jgi:aquaporin Z
MFPLPMIFGIEILASALLMVVIYAVVLTKGLKGFSGIAIGGIVGLDIYSFGLISGASMNPARSLAPAVLSGSIGDLWLYWSAPFIGTILVAMICRISLVTDNLTCSFVNQYSYILQRLSSSIRSTLNQQRCTIKHF